MNSERLTQMSMTHRRNGFYNAPNQYSNAKRGYRKTSNGYIFFRSQTEANFAFFLDYCGIRWQYEPKTFWFEKIKRGCRSYTPDFYLPDEDLYVELKGQLDKKSKTKLKRMEKYYPDIKIRLIEWKAYRELEKHYRKLIPQWNLEGLTAKEIII